MNTSFTRSETFTITDAKKLASQVATDLKRMQRFYNAPSDSQIEDFEKELIELLKEGYLGEIRYGFRKDGEWICPTLIYTAKELAGGINDDPGKIPPDADISGAIFYNYLTQSESFRRLTNEQQDAFNNRLPFQRVGAPNPPIKGYLSSDKSYSSGGVTLDRKIVKNL